MGARENVGVRMIQGLGPGQLEKGVAIYRVGTGNVGAASVEGRTRSSLSGMSCSKCIVESGHVDGAAGVWR